MDIILFSEDGLPLLESSSLLPVKGYFSIVTIRISVKLLQNKYCDRHCTYTYMTVNHDFTIVKL